MKSSKFSLNKRLNSFRYAWQGIVALVRDEHNARIHMVAAVVATVMGFWLKISSMEWVAIIGCIGAVIATEAMNSAVEAVCDKVSPEKHELIKKAKDCGAAAVLIVSISAAIIGCVVFLPKVIKLFHIL
ncbi:MAG: diacylglycerol kinase family protein [Rikenellaceae bacterium]